MALDVDHDVSVVPVLDLQNVANERIGGEGLAEVLTRCLVGLAPRGAELIPEVVDDAYLLSSKLLFDARDAQRIVAYFDQAASLSGGEDLVRLEPQVDLLLFEYLIKLTNQLDCELLLPDVVICLHDDAEELPGQ